MLSLWSQEHKPQICKYLINLFSVRGGRITFQVMLVKLGMWTEIMTVFVAVVVTTFVTVALMLAVIMRQLRGMKGAWTEATNLLWFASDRADKGSNKAEFLEHRAMSTNLRCHELLRMVMTDLSEFQEDCDRTWLLRRLADWVAMFTEAKVRTYGQGVNVVPALRFILRTIVDRVNSGGMLVEHNRLRKIFEFENQHFRDHGCYPFHVAQLRGEDLFDESNITHEALLRAAFASDLAVECRQVADHFWVPREFWQVRATEPASSHEAAHED